MSIPNAPTVLDRLWKNMRALIRAEFPRFDYSGISEYAVVAISADGSAADVAPTDTTLPLPGMIKVPLRASLLGEVVNLRVGSQCLVAFINQDPTRPMVIGADPIPVKATVDASAELDIGPTATVVKLGLGAKPVAALGDLAGGIFPITTTVNTKVLV